MRRSRSPWIARLGVVILAALCPPAEAGAADLGLSMAPVAVAPVAPPARGPGFELLSLQRRGVKWGVALPGTGATIAYAFVTVETERPGAINCRSIGPIPEVLPSAHVAGEAFRDEIRAALAEWAAPVALRFVETEAAAAGLLIGMQVAPRGIAYSDVIPEPGGEGMMTPIRQAAICFNPRLAWEAGFDGDEKTPDVRYVAAHEIGHILGLDHSWGEALMNFKYIEKLRGPQAGDLAGAAFLYGHRLPAPPAAPVLAPPAFAPPAFAPPAFVPVSSGN